MSLVFFCLRKSLEIVLLGFEIDKQIWLVICTNIWLQKQRNSSLVNLKSQAQASLWREWDFLTVPFAGISDCFFRMMFLTKTLIWLWIYRQISKCKMLIWLSKNIKNVLNKLYIDTTRLFVVKYTLI